jgi:carbonic anhydrase
MNYNADINPERIPVKVQLIKVNNDPALIHELKSLLIEYGNYMYQELGLVAGIEKFYKELENLPGSEYIEPLGTFVIAKIGKEVAGCVGIKKFDDNSCEMKRMYVVRSYRGKGIGQLLCNFVITWSQKAMYKRILLDTNVEMKEAVLLYKKCGFEEIEPYCINENEHPVFLQYIL